MPMPEHDGMLVLWSQHSAKHDFHIVAISNFRCDRFRRVLSARVSSASDPIAGRRELVLLWLWPARTFATTGSRSFRNVSVFDFGPAESCDMAAGRYHLQSRALGVLQIQILVRRSDVSRFGWCCAD